MAVKRKSNMPEGIPTTPVPMPSADLVTFRFDQMDKEMSSLHSKLDNLTINFATKEEFATVQRQMDNWRWYLRAMVVAVFTALSTAIGSLLINRR